MSEPSPRLPLRLVASVRGSVQGVGYRWFAKREATRLDLSGWVANQADGSVEVVVEARPDILEGFIDRLRDGPAGAAVSEVTVRFEPARGNLGGFEIRSGAHRGD